MPTRPVTEPPCRPWIGRIRPSSPSPRRAHAELVWEGLESIRRGLTDTGQAPRGRVAVAPDAEAAMGIDLRATTRLALARRYDRNGGTGPIVITAGDLETMTGRS